MIVMNRIFFLFTSLLLLSGCGEFSGFAVPLEPREPQTELLKTLAETDDTEAASELSLTFDVPQHLLLALAWSGSSFVESDPEHGECSPRFGWLGLSERQRVRAAELTGLSLAKISSEREAGMIAGAALLDELRQQIDPGASGVILDARWWPIVAAFADTDDEWINAQFALDIFGVLQRGFEVEDALGRLVVLSPKHVPGLTEVVLPPPPSGSEARDGGSGYPARAQFLAAHSSNFGSRSGGTSSIDSIVIHTIEGSHSSAIHWFQNPSSNVSAHYLVKRSDGAVTQMVYDENRAWHATNYNSRSIGIEHEGHAHSSSNWTEAMLEGSARLAAWLATQYDIPVDRQHFIGHSEVTGSGKSDPGSHFPWDRYLTMVRCYQGVVDCEAEGVSPPEFPNEPPPPGSPGGDTPPDPHSPEDPSWTLPYSPARATWNAPSAGAEVGNPVVLDLDWGGGAHLEILAGAARMILEDLLDPLVRTIEFETEGLHHLTARVLSATGTVLHSTTIEVSVADTRGRLHPTATPLGGIHYRFRTVLDGLPETAYVIYSLDGYEITDDSGAPARATHPNFELVKDLHPFHVSHAATLIAKAYDIDGAFLGEGVSHVEIKDGGGIEGEISSTIYCGDTIADNTRQGFPEIDSYVDVVGSYPGREIAYLLDSPLPGEEVEFTLLSTEPDVDLDLIILKQNYGKVSPHDTYDRVLTSGVVELDPFADWTLVVDGFNGDEGAFELTVNCHP
jgi:hypothetical protein